MRFPLLILPLLAFPALAQAQSQRPSPPPPARERPRVIVIDRYPQYAYPPVRLSIDSASNLAENRYQGWQVESKTLVRAYDHQYYNLTMIVAGEVGYNELHLDADTGETIELTHLDPDGQRTNLMPPPERRHHRRGTGASDY